jgi:hypothetical protein
MKMKQWPMTGHAGDSDQMQSPAHRAILVNILVIVPLKLLDFAPPALLHNQCLHLLFQCRLKPIIY